MSDPAILAAVRAIATLLPELVAWFASALRGGSDPESELRILMSSAEEAARATERAKFGGSDES